MKVEQRPAYPDALLVPFQEPELPARGEGSDDTAARYLIEMRAWAYDLRRRLEIIRCLEVKQDPKSCGIQEYSTQLPR